MRFDPRIRTETVRKEAVPSCWGSEAGQMEGRVCRGPSQLWAGNTCLRLEAAQSTAVLSDDGDRGKVLMTLLEALDPGTSKASATLELPSLISQSIPFYLSQFKMLFCHLQPRFLYKTPRFLTSPQFTEFLKGAHTGYREVVPGRHGAAY